MNPSDGDDIAADSRCVWLDLDATLGRLDTTLERILHDEDTLRALDFALAGGPPREPGILDQWGTAAAFPNRR